MDTNQDRFDTVDVDGRVVKRRRAGKQFTQKKLSELSGVSRAWISVIEGTDNARVSRDVGARLALVLDCDLADLQKKTRAEGEADSAFAFSAPIPTVGASDEWEEILSDMELLAKRMRRFVSEQRKRR